jgi:hypothetical protein
VWYAALAALISGPLQAQNVSAQQAALRDIQEVAADISYTIWQRGEQSDIHLVFSILPIVDAATGDDLAMRVQAAVAGNCRRLQFWPRITASDIQEITHALETLQAQTSEPSADGLVPSHTLANLNRCLAGAYLLSGIGPPRSFRKALPYLYRSLAFDPEQSQLRVNILFLERTLLAGKEDIYEGLVNTMQIIRGADDPEIPALAKEIAGYAKSQKPK